KVGGTALDAELGLGDQGRCHAVYLVVRADAKELDGPIGIFRVQAVLGEMDEALPALADLLQYRVPPAELRLASHAYGLPGEEEEPRITRIARIKKKAQVRFPRKSATISLSLARSNDPSYPWDPCHPWFSIFLSQEKQRVTPLDLSSGASAAS